MPNKGAVYCREDNESEVKCIQSYYWHARINNDRSYEINYDYTQITSRIRVT